MYGVKEECTVDRTAREASSPLARLLVTGVTCTHRTVAKTHQNRLQTQRGADRGLAVQSLVMSQSSNL